MPELNSISYLATSVVVVLVTCQFRDVAKIFGVDLLDHIASGAKPYVIEFCIISEADLMENIHLRVQHQAHCIFIIARIDDDFPLAFQRGL